MGGGSEKICSCNASRQLSYFRTFSSHILKTAASVFSTNTWHMKKLICNGNKQSGFQIELIIIGNEQKNKGAWGQAGSPQLRSHIGCTRPHLVLVWFHHICIKNKTKLRKELATIMRLICLLAGDWMCAHQCVLGSDHNMWLIALSSCLLSVFFSLNCVLKIK